MLSKIILPALWALAAGTNHTTGNDTASTTPILTTTSNVTDTVTTTPDAGTACTGANCTALTGTISLSLDFGNATTGGIAKMMLAGIAGGLGVDLAKVVIDWIEVDTVRTVTPSIGRLLAVKVVKVGYTATVTNAEAAAVTALITKLKDGDFATLKNFYDALKTEAAAQGLDTSAWPTCGTTAAACDLSALGITATVGDDSAPSGGGAFKTNAIGAMLAALMCLVF